MPTGSAGVSITIVIAATMTNTAKVIQGRWRRTSRPAAPTSARISGIRIGGSGDHFPDDNGVTSTQNPLRRR